MASSGSDTMPTLLGSYLVQYAKVVLISSSDFGTSFVLLALPAGMYIVHRHKQL